jgi:fatty acid desaturase
MRDAHTTVSTTGTGELAQQISSSDYAELKRLIRQHGLLEPQLRYYSWLTAFILCLLLLSVTLLLAFPHSWFQLANAVLAAFVFTQIGFLGHDAGHRQICRVPRHNEFLGLVLGNLLIGLSFAWWNDKHNRHHGNPNHLDLDPDVEIPGIAFCKESATRKRGLARFLVKYQAFFFIPLLTVAAVNFQFRSILFLLHRKPRGQRFLVEAGLLATHHLLYWIGVLVLMGIWQGLLFMLVHQCILGLYMGMTFASNHKGMLVLDQTYQMSFLHRQILTTRNLRANPVLDFLFGGLGCQIEHHLFPSIPRNNLRAAAPTIRAFCQAHAIMYHETGVLAAFREILCHLHHVGATVRR